MAVVEFTKILAGPETGSGKFPGNGDRPVRIVQGRVRGQGRIREDGQDLGQIHRSSEAQRHRQGEQPPQH